MSRSGGVTDQAVGPDGGRWCSGSGARHGEGDLAADEHVVSSLTHFTWTLSDGHFYFVCIITVVDTHNDTNSLSFMIF